MDVQVDCGITDILEIYCKQFYSVCLDEEPEFYLKYKKMDQNEKFNTFIYTIIQDNPTFVRYYAILIDKGCDKKELNKFFYYYLKMKHKSEKKIFSWNELLEFNIDPNNEDMDIKTTSTYKFF